LDEKLSNIDFAIKGLVICDDTSRITWVEMGWLGSVHNNRFWANSEIYLSRDKYFDQKEYLLGDLAFSYWPTCSARLVRRNHRGFGSR